MNYFVNPIAAISILTISFCGYTYGPDEHALMFNASFGPGKHFSTIADEEKNFSEDFDFYVWYNDTIDNIHDTVELSYKYLDLSADINASWFFNEILSFGLNYQYGNINQSINYDKWDKSASLFDLHRLSIMSSYWPMFRKKISISASLLAGPGFGSLHRFAVINRNYVQSDAMSTFVSTAHQKIDCVAFTAGARINLHWLFSDSFYLFAAGAYDFAATTLKDDPIQGYPEKHRSHDFSVRFGLGFVTNSQ